MIEGYIDNNKIFYKTNMKVIDNKEYVLIIDGNVDDNYYQEIIDSYKNNKLVFLDNMLDFISIYLFDKEENSMYLITDRIGAKKIYYTVNDNILYFSNDLRTLNIKEKIINLDSLSIYFRHHFIQEPYTIYKDVYKIEHGYYLKYKNNKINKKCYWNLIDVFNKRELLTDYKEIENKLEKILKKQITSLVHNKKNIGVYQSGGIDSNTVSSIYNSITDDNINNYTIGFEEAEFDETTSSVNTSNYINANLHKMLLKNKDALKNVKKITDYYPEPFGDVSAIATIALNEFAHKNNIENALTGDGADQLFCGANIYDTMYKIQKASIINPLNIHINNKCLKNKKLFYLFGSIPSCYKAQSDVIFKEQSINNLFKDDGIKRFDIEKLIDTNNLQEKRMILDLDTFMAQRTFVKMCIAANKNNISVLSPFLTKDVIEFSFKIPHKYKYHNKIKKYILKKVLYKYIPESYFSNKKKGFAIPTKKWLHGDLNKDLKRLSTKDFITKQGIFNYDRVLHLINNIDEDLNLTWDYYMFQLWYEKNMIK